MNKENIVIAVLGTGSIGLRHLKILSSLTIKTIAVPVRKERIVELQKEGFTTAKNLEEAKSMGAIGVVICTDTSRHIEDCSIALDLNLIVLCEKPLASNLKQTEKIKNYVKNNLYVGYNLRYDRGFEKLFKLAGDIGEIYFLSAECRSYLPHWRKNRNYLQNYSARKDEGGVILDLSHEIDYLNFFFEKPYGIYGIAKNYNILGIAEEEYASAILKYERNCSSIIVLDYLSLSHIRKCTLSSVSTTLSYDFSKKRITISSKKKEKIILVKRDENTLYKEELKDFIAIIKGKEPRCLCNYFEALNVLSIIESWKKSEKIKREVKINYGS